jgi:beta-phosphoglucomutase
VPAREVIDAWLRSAQPAVIFDFNGTLSDDEPILFDIFSELFRVHLGWDMTAQDYREDLLGRSDREIIEHAVARHGKGTRQEVARLLRVRQGIYRHRVADKSPIVEATVVLVKLLADNGIPTAIVTGAQRDDVMAVLEASPVGGLFTIVIAEEDVTNGKPHPEGFLEAARLLDRRPGDVLVFEDSVPGVGAALAAGMYCVAVGGPKPSAQLRAVAPAVVSALSAKLLSDALTGWRRVQTQDRPPAI